jgi:hypothetical protein
MNISEATAFTYKGKSAEMYVLRNNGYCWGRVITSRGLQLDVSTRRDHYDREDGDAANAFIRKAKRGGVEPMAGSPL